MRTPQRVVVLAAALAVVLVVPAAPEEAAGADPLVPLARLLGGEWVARGAVVNAREAEPLDLVVSYRWGVNRKLVKSESYVVRAGERRLEFETMIGWHPRAQTLVFFSVSAEGAVFEGTIQPRGDELEFRWEAFEENAATAYRQTLRFTGPDEYTSSLLRRGGAGWERISEATFRRRVSP